VEDFVQILLHLLTFSPDLSEYVVTFYNIFVNICQNYCANCDVYFVHVFGSSYPIP